MIAARKAVEIDNDMIKMTQEFTNELIRSKDPLLILLIGEGRTGKSTRGNQLVKGVLVAKEPFKTQDGHSPVTIGVDFVGPIKYRDLLPNHQVLTNVNRDSDVFILDCEGAYNLDDKDKENMIRKLRIAFMQICTISAFVTKQLNLLNIYDIKYCIGVSKLLPIGKSRSSTNVCIIIRDDLNNNDNLSIEEFNEKRKREDREIQEMLKGKFLRDNHYQLTDDDFRVITQPDIRFENEYWESMRDFVKFFENAVNNRAIIPGSVLIEMFNKVISYINQFDELDNLEIPLQEIFSSILDEIFTRSMKSAESVIGRLSQEIESIGVYDLKTFDRSSFEEAKFNKAVEEFEKESENIYPDICLFFEERKNRYVDEIRNKIHDIVEKTLHSRCLRQFIPLIYGEALKKYKMEIQEMMSTKGSIDLRVFDIDQFSYPYYEKAAKEFKKTISRLCESAISSKEFKSKSKELVNELRERMKSIYNQRVEDCPPFPHTVAEARKSGQRGSEVELWGYDNKTSHKWKVDKNDRILVDGFTATKTTEIFKYVGDQ